MSAVPALTLLVRNFPTLEFANNQQPVPALEAFFSRCNVQNESYHSSVEWMCAMFGVERQRDWPVAPLLMQAQGATGSAFWICAQPVHLAVERDDLILQPVAQMHVSEDESRRFFSVVEAHLAQERLQMVHVQAGLWCVGAREAQRLSTTDIELAEGRSVDGLLPAGEDAPRWQRLVTEAQMTLHEHPQNVAREQRGEAVVNSVWIWGGGSAAVVNKRFDKMCVVDPLLRAAAVLTDTQLVEAPVRATEFIADGHALLEFIVHDSDVTGRSLAALETHWLSPAWQALATGALDELTVVLTSPNAVRVCTCDRKARRKFWKRKRPLHWFLGRWPVNA